MESIAPTLRVSHLSWPVTALGPGRRVALWLAGCSLACKGCITPQLQAPSSGYAVPWDAVLSRLLHLPEALDGLTVTGGEPFEQAAVLHLLLAALHRQRPEWSILLFSGYPLEYLQHKRDDAARVLPWLDLLVDGPYIESYPSSHPLLASRNQQLHALTPRGQRLLPACERIPFGMVNAGIGQHADWLIGIVDPQQRAHAHCVIHQESEEPSGG